MQTLDTMRGGIQHALETDQKRGSAATQCLASAQAVARCFVLTHRTVSPGGSTLQEILSEGRLKARVPCTQREIDCGLTRVVYFFLGCAAYPEGAVAFLVPSRLLDHIPASYSPFDTGSLSNYARLRDPLRPWDDADKRVFLESHLGYGADAVAFSAEYVAAHFEVPTDYVRRAQQSEPDFPAYHDLVSTTRDRRAWSIEVQMHDDLDLDHIEAIVIGQGDLLADIPDDLVGRAVVPENEGSITSMIHHIILRGLS